MRTTAVLLLAFLLPLATVQAEPHATPASVEAPNAAHVELIVDTLLRPENEPRLRALLTQWFSSGRLRPSDLREVEAVPSPTTSSPVAVRAPHPLDAQAVIVAAIERGAPLFNAGHHEACAELYASAAEKLLHPGQEALSDMDRDDLHAAMHEHAADASERAWNLRHAFDRILANHDFEPRMEASLPAGFPGPGPLGRVVEKRYPRYRAARADGGGSFWTLFQHIKKNDVEMTAPVEMTMGDDMRVRDMAFLYEAPEQGAAGMDGAVRVLDLEPMTVLSIGMRGARGTEQIARAQALVEAHRKAHGMTHAGSWRVMGYNSPMVPASQRYWELQLPVSK